MDMHKGGVFLAVALLTGVMPAVAQAEAAESEYGDYEPPPAVRRSGFTVGLSWGPTYLNAVGYPNKLAQIDVPEFEESFAGYGAGSSIWLGGALRDWFTFALGVSSRSDFDQQLINGAFVVRLEGFPLFSLGGEYRDLGVLGEFGAGGSTIHRDDEVVADGGAMSVLGLGVFYEPWTFWKFSCGPALQYTREFSQSMTSDAVTLAIRTSLYTTQPD